MADKLTGIENMEKLKDKKLIIIKDNMTMFDSFGVVTDLDKNNLKVTLMFYNNEEDKIHISDRVYDKNIMIDNNFMKGAICITDKASNIDINNMEEFLKYHLDNKEYNRNDNNSITEFIDNLNNLSRGKDE